MSQTFNYCSDCHGDVRRMREIHYKIKSEVWLKVANSSEFLCIKCLERRLGREISPDDFTRESINRKNQFNKSALLLNRLDKNIHRMKQLKKGVQNVP